jgi:selenocysteine lyase/cysteine desulfurase
MKSLNDQIGQLYSMTYGHPKIQTPFGSRYLINADVTASGYPNKNIEKIMSNQVLPYYANTHSNAYCGRLMSHYIEQSKESVRKSVNANSSDRIIFTGNGCSGSINHLIHCLDLKSHNPETTVVLISRAEHHSNHLVWTHLPVTLIYLPVLSTGLIDISALERRLQKFKDYPNKIVSLIATSNVNGVHQDTSAFSQLVHQYQGVIFWDYAASAPYIPINMHRQTTSKLTGDYFDAIFISPHKFFGGQGTPGLLVANQSLFKNKVPFCPGGGTVRFVCPSFQTYTENIEVKETGGTPDITGSIKVGLVFDLKSKYQNLISAREQQLTQWVQSRLLKIRNLKLLNPIGNLNRMPIFIFNLPPLHYNLVVVLLNDLFGIQTRGGISCCSLLAQDLLKLNTGDQKKIYNQIVNDKGVPANYGWCRLSLHYCLPDHVIEYIIRSVEMIARWGQSLQKLYKYYPQKNNWLYCPGGCPWNDFSKVKLDINDHEKTIQTTYLTWNQLHQQLIETQSVIAKLTKNSTGD